MNMTIFIWNIALKFQQSKSLTKAIKSMLILPIVQLSGSVIIGCGSAWGVEPINPLAVLNRLMGLLPSVIRVECNPNP